MVLTDEVLVAEDESVAARGLSSKGIRNPGQLVEDVVIRAAQVIGAVSSRELVKQNKASVLVIERIAQSF